MENVIEIKPYLQFIRLEYEIEDEDFLAEHTQLKGLQKFLYQKRDEYFKKEAQKLIEQMEKEKVR